MSSANLYVTIEWGDIIKYMVEYLIIVGIQHAVFKM